jgi:PAS domain-containing protein
MQLPLPRAHRFARINYRTRSGSFAFSFVVVLAFLWERDFNGWTLFLAVQTLLVYPQLAYLHARIEIDSKRAEFRNLNFDSAMMGMWAAQLHFSLWPVCAALAGVCLNNAVCGGVGRFMSGLLYFAGAALLWAMLWGSPFEPSTGPLVTALCILGMVGYVGWLAIFFHGQNRSLVGTRNVLRTSEEQFRFIAEHVGDLACVLTPEYRLRYASPSHARYFEPGRFAEGQDWLGLIHPQDRVRANEFLGLLRVSADSERAQLRMVPAKGSPRLVECEGNPVRDEDGSLQTIVLVCRGMARALEPVDLRAVDAPSRRDAQSSG